MSETIETSTKAERVCVALEYLIWHGADGKCDISKVAGDAKSELERLRAALEEIRDHDICSDGIPEDFKYVQASGYHKFQKIANKALNPDD